MSNELGNTPADKNYKPSGISRAEERARAYENGLDYYHYTGDNPSVAYKAGYEAAEKDLALTWEDAQLLYIITEKYMREIDNRIEKAPSSSQEVFEEIIRRYKEAKK